MFAYSFKIVIHLVSVRGWTVKKVDTSGFSQWDSHFSRRGTVKNIKKYRNKEKYMRK